MLLKQTIKIKSMELRNRIAMAPMDTGRAVDGRPDADMIEHYRERARGTGLVIVEHAHVLPEGMAHARQLSFARDDVVEAYQKLTEAIRGEGACSVAQISHAGARARDTGRPVLGPSAVSVRGGERAEEMTQADIARVVRGFAEAAARVKAAGFDGVEVHAAHGYLLNQFYSPLTNRRTDAYGAQTVESRTRLHREILAAVRAAVGQDFPVAIRFGGCDYAEGGSRIEDIPEAAGLLEAAGADLLDISGGLMGYVRPEHSEPGYFKELSLAARSAVSVPLLLTGGVTTAEDMETLLEEGAAELIGVGRAILKDPAWSLKALKLG